MAAVSIVIPIYNVEPYLRPCLDSVLAQTLEDIEVIAVDDGSPDGCGAICDEYAARDGRVRVIHKPNGGLVSAWKAGVLAASAAYVGFVDGDDWVDPAFFEDLLRGAADAGADIAVGERIGERAVPLLCTREKTALYRGEEAVRRLLQSFFLNCLIKDMTRRPISYSRCDKLYRRQLLLDNMAYFDERVTLDEDRVANAAILADCRTVVLLSGTGKYHYRTTPHSMSASSVQVAAGNIPVLIDALEKVAREKRLDSAAMETYIGADVYTCIFALAGQSGLADREKRALARQVLSRTPADALKRYARARGGLFIRLFCAMLRARLIAPCLWTAALYLTVTGQNH